MPCGTRRDGGVRIECQQERRAAAAAVEDTGIGIAPEDQARIFNEFVQIENPHRSRDRGVGLGLAIVRHISRAAGLRGEVTRAAGRGTRMSLHVPIAAASVGMQNPVADAAHPSATCGPARVDRRRRRRRARRAQRLFPEAELPVRNGALTGDELSCARAANGDRRRTTP